MTPGETAEGMTAPVREVGDAAALLKRNTELLAEIKQVISRFAEQLTPAADAAEDTVKELKDLEKLALQEKKNAKKDRTVSEKILEALGGPRFKTAGGPVDGGARTGSRRAKATASPDGGKDGIEYGHEFGDSVSHALSNSVASVMTGFLAGASLYQLLTTDMLKQEYLFAQGMKEIAYQTKSIAGDAPDMQKAFRATSEAVKSTGFDLTTYQNTLFNASKRGLKDTQSIVRTGLNLGKMMGLTEDESSQIAENFGDWSQHLGMDSLQLADISRGVQDVARQTGLVGQNLMEVTKQTERFMTEMRNAGSLTAVSTKNMMMLVAEAKKLGVSDTMGDLMTALSSGSNFLLKANDETKNLALMAADAGGVTQELFDGVILQTKSGLKGMARGMEETFKHLTGGIELTEEAIKNLSATERNDIDLMLQSMFGKGIEQYRREMESFDKAGAGFSEKMADITKQLGANATAEEILTAERAKQQLLMSKSFEFSSVLAENAKNASSFEDAVTRMQNSMSPSAWKETQVELSEVAGQFSKELKNGVMSGSKTAIAEAMALSAAQALKQAGGEDFTDKVTSVLKNNDMAGLRSLQEDMNKEQQKLGIKELTALDPMSEIAMTIKQINESIRSFTGPAITALITMVGSTGLMVGLLASIAAGSIFKIKSLKAFGDILGLGKGADGKAGGLRSFFGGGKDAAAAGGSKGGLGGFFGGKGGGGGGAAPSGGGGGGGGGGDFEFGNLGKAAPKILKGALGLALLSIGLTAIAVGILKIAEGIMSISGLEPKEMAVIGLTVAGLIAGLGIIAYAVEQTAPALSNMEKIKPLIGKMVLGGAILLPVALGLVALGSSLLFLSSKVMGAFGLNPTIAMDTAKAVATILTAAGIIAVATIAGMLGLAGLGALAAAVTGPQALLIAGGAAALLILAPLMTLLGAAVIKISGAMASVVDIGEAERTADAVGTILMAAGKIAVGTVMGLAACAALGAGAFLLLSNPGGWIAGLIAGGLIAAGAATLMTLAPLMVLLAAAVVKIVGAVTSAVNVGEAGKAAEAVGNILKAAGDIASSIIWTAGKLAVLGAMAFMAPGLAGFAWAGVGALALLSLPVTALAIGVMTFATAISALFPEGAAKVAVDNLNYILIASEQIAKSTLAAAGKLALLGSFASFAPFFAAAAWAGVLAFGMVAAPVAALVTSLVTMANAMPTIKASKLKTLKAFPDLIESIFKITNSFAPLAKMSKKKFRWGALIGLSKNLFSSDLDDLVKGSQDFSKGFGKIKNIVVKLLDGMDEMGDFYTLEEKVKTVKGVADVLESIPKILEGMSKLSELSTDGWVFDSDLTNLIQALEKNDMTGQMKQMGNFVSKILKEIDPSIFGDSYDLEEKVKIVSGIGTVMEAIPKIIASMSSLNDLTADGIVFDSKLTNLLQALEGSEIEKQMQSLSRVANIIVSAFSQLGDSYTLGDVGASMESLNKVFDAFLKLVGADGVFQKLSELATDDWSWGPSQLKALTTSLEEGFKDFKFPDIFGTISKGLPAITQIEATIQRLDLLITAMDKFQEMMAKLSEMAIKINEFDLTTVDEKKLAEILKLSSMLPTTMASDVVDVETKAPKPLPVTDVHQKMQQKHASDIAANVQQHSGNYGDLISINENQLNYLMLMHGDLEKLVDLMTPDKKSSGNTGRSGANSTRSNTKPLNSPNYYEWQFGQNSQTADTNVVTDGR